MHKVTMVTGERNTFCRSERDKESYLHFDWMLEIHNPSRPSSASSPQTSAGAPGWRRPPREWERCNTLPLPGSATCTWQKASGVKLARWQWWATHHNRPIITGGSGEYSVYSTQKISTCCWNPEEKECDSQQHSARQKWHSCPWQEVCKKKLHLSWCPSCLFLMHKLLLGVCIWYAKVAHHKV